MKTLHTIIILIFAALVIMAIRSHKEPHYSWLKDNTGKVYRGVKKGNYYYTTDKEGNKYTFIIDGDTVSRVDDMGYEMEYDYRGEDRSVNNW